MKKSQRELLVNRASATLVTALLVVTFSLFCVGMRAYAQSTGATLSGAVVDPNGAIIAGAAVTIMNPGTGFTREATTNDEGIYTFLSLAPGSYSVTARSAGFASAEVKEVVLNVNDRRSLQIQLRVGQVGETVTVNEEGASLINESPAVATTVNRQFVENLPLNGRSFQALIELTPGVVVTPTDAFNQGQFSINGQRASSNSFSVDGVSANFGGVGSANLHQFAGGVNPALSAQGGFNNLVSVDALQEFSIQTSTYAPEFGRTVGGQISILTRSGTNDFRGSVFEYFRNDALDANDWFNNSVGLPKAALRQNNFGFVLGGPVLLPRFGEGGRLLSYNGRNRTFFFFSYEGLRLRLPQTRITDVPTLAARAAAPAGARPVFNAFPLPNGPVNPGDPNLARFSATFSDISNLNAYSARIDHSLNSRLQLFGRFSYTPSDLVQRASVPEGQFAASNLFRSVFKTRTLTFGSTWSISNNLVNDFRLNFSRHRAGGFLTQDGFGGATPLTTSAFFTTPQPFTETDSLFVASIILGGTGLNLGLGKNVDNVQRQFNVVDNISLVRGNHNLKFGGDYRRLSPLFAPRDSAFVVAYLNVALAALGPLVTAVQTSRGGTIFLNNLGLFAQDTWKASPRLTLTYGVRWDVDSHPTLGEGLQPLAVTGFGDDLSTLALAPAGTPLWQTTYNNFGPRVGVAYQLRQKPGRETVLRGGFGVFYDLASEQAGQLAEVDYPPFGASRQSLGPLFGGTATFPFDPAGAQPPAIGSNIPFIGATIYNPNLKLPYTLQWNFAVEQSLGANQTISVSYVAAAGRRLLQSEATRGVKAGVFSSPAIVDNTATSDYNSMQVQFQRRLSRGLQALASYTWAHSIDTASASGAFSATGGTNSDARSRSLDPNANRASSSFDIRHTLTAGVTYNLPAPFAAGAARAVLGGWSVDTIFRARSATPLTVIDQNVVARLRPDSQTTIYPDLVPGVPVYLTGNQYPGGKALNPAAFADPPLVGGVPTRQGTLGRNVLRGFGANQVDFTLRRQFKLTERVNLQFRSEFFNLFNHPNFGPPNTAFFTGSNTFGQATTTLGRSLNGGGSGGVGFSQLYQIGGPRSIQLSLKLQF